MLRWKEAEALPAAGDNPLLRELGQLCNKTRLLELLHDFVVFDAGIKKICRHNQYFGVRAAQARVKRREGGIVWHTQGSGKSLMMIWLAKWIREHVTNGRVLIITDRTELDEQIEKFFLGVDEQIYRTKSGADLVRVLNASEEWLTCSLIHKFGASDEGDIEAFLADILMDMATRDRLNSGHGNALLVSGSIYSACRFFEMFQQTDLAGKCAIVTSYRPSPADIKGEESGEGRSVVRAQDSRTYGRREGAAQATVGHDAEGAVRARPPRENRR